MYHSLYHSYPKLFNDGNNNALTFAVNSTFTVNANDKTQVIVENKDANGLVDLLENRKNYTLKITEGLAGVAGNVDAVSNSFNTSDFVVTDTNTFDNLNVSKALLGTDNKTIELTLSTPTSVDGKYKLYVKGNITDLDVVGNVTDSNYRIALFNGIDAKAPTLSDVQLKGKLSDNTDTSATIVVSNLDGNNTGTITISGLQDTAKYTTSSVKLSKNVGVTFDATNDQYDIKTPIQVSKDTDSAALSSLVLTVLSGVYGATRTQLVNENNSTLKLIDSAGNTATYTIVIQ